MDMESYARLLRRRAPVLAIFVLIGAVAGWMTATEAQEREFHRATYIFSQRSDRDLGRLAYLATVGAVPERVAERLGEDPASVGSQIYVTSDSLLGTLTFTATQPTPDRALALVTAFADELRAALEAQATSERQNEIENLQVSIGQLEDRIAELNTTIGFGVGNLALLVAERDALTQQFAASIKRIETLTGASPPGSGLSVLQRPVVREVGPGTPVVRTNAGAQDNERPVTQSFTGDRPRPAVADDPMPLTQRIPLGGVIGLLVGLGVILLVDRLDTRIRSRAAAETAFALPVLAEIPRLPRPRRKLPSIALNQEPNSVAAEAYRVLRTTLALAPVATDGNGSSGLPSHGADSPTVAGPGGPMVVLVTSAGGAEGKTSVVANLAAAFAEASRVLVVDCDVRQPRLHQYLRPDEEVTVADHVASGQTLSIAALATPTTMTNVWLARLNDGRVIDNPTDLLIRQRALIDEARRHADVILVDTSPILLGNEFNELLPIANRLLIIARWGRTRPATARRVKDLLELLDAPPAGVVLTAVPDRPASYQYDRAERTRRAGDGEAEPSVRPTEPFVPPALTASRRNGETDRTEELSGEPGGLHPPARPRRDPS